jgi:hypothetical protein
MVSTLAFAGLTPLFANAATAGDSVVVTIIDGYKARADISLQDGSGGHYTAEFELEFETENLQNLTPACVGITADVLDGSEIADIESRLPHPGGVQQTIDPAFPVRITVEPPANCGLTFQNQYDVTLDTPDLVYAPFSPYRLVKAPIGGQFRYVTGTVTQGSVRARGRTGAFSEFVMIRDNLPAYAADCEHEYNDLETRIASSSMSPTARRALEVDIEVSRAAYEAGDLSEAISRLADFDAHCVEYAGVALPNRWRSTRDLDDVEGDLVGRTNSLRFMMGRLNGSP